jgi:signal-transduction protein with cAMP-binding, CBS, and nucleotidyltransferase domain
MVNKTTNSLDNKSKAVPDLKKLEAETHSMPNPYQMSERAKQPMDQLVPLTIQMIRREFDLPPQVSFIFFIYSSIGRII